MNWELIIGISEVIGALAIVATLIFLAIEVRNNRGATESASLDALAAGFTAINANVIDDPEVTKLWVSGLADPEKLDHIDRVRFAILVQSYLNQYNALKKYHTVGVLSDDEWSMYTKPIAAIMNSPGGRWMWDTVTTTPAILSELEEYRNVDSNYRWMGSSNNS